MTELHSTWLLGHASLLRNPTYPSEDYYVTSMVSRVFRISLFSVDLLSSPTEFYFLSIAT